MREGVASMVHFRVSDLLCWLCCSRHSGVDRDVSLGTVVFAVDVAVVQMPIGRYD